MYFISNDLEVKKGKKGLGIFAANDIPADTIIEVSPFSSCFSETWANTPENLRKIVYSFPQNSDNYVIGLGYTSIYNHDDNNNAFWYTEKDAILIKTLRKISKCEEICIHYGDNYWSGGWPKI